MFYLSLSPQAIDNVFIQCQWNLPNNKQPSKDSRCGRASGRAKNTLRWRETRKPGRLVGGGLAMLFPALERCERVKFHLVVHAGITWSRRDDLGSAHTPPTHARTPTTGCVCIDCCGQLAAGAADQRLLNLILDRHVSFGNLQN